MPSILEVQSLVKKYGDFTAVKGISFDIKEGEFSACSDRMVLARPQLSQCCPHFMRQLQVMRPLEVIR